MKFVYLALCAIIGYLFGAVSTGLILSARKHINIRQLGSKSTGATNVTRVMGLKSGLITFVGDMAKAVVSVLIGWAIAGRNGGLIGGLFAIIGHNWPVFYSFLGGKGVACSVAVLFLCAPLAAVIAGTVGLLVIWLTRYVSLGSLTFLLMSAILIPFFYDFWPMGVWAILLLALGTYQHRANIGRLIKGTENKFTGAKQVDTDV